MNKYEKCTNTILFLLVLKITVDILYNFIFSICFPLLLLKCLKMIHTLKIFWSTSGQSTSRELNSECWRQDRKLKSRWSHHKSKNFYKQCCLFAAFLHQSKKSFFDNKQSKNITVKQKNDRPIFLDILHTNFMAVSFCTLEKFSV